MTLNDSNVYHFIFFYGPSLVGALKLMQLTVSPTYMYIIIPIDATSFPGAIVLDAPFFYQHALLDHNLWNWFIKIC